MHSSRLRRSDSQSVIDLAGKLVADGRHGEALILCDYVLSREETQCQPHHCAALALAGLGRISEAHAELMKAQEKMSTTEAILASANFVLQTAGRQFNDKMAQNEFAAAAEIVDAMVTLSPANLHILSRALKLATTISDEEKIVRYAHLILNMRVDDWQANSALAGVFHARGDAKREKLRLAIGDDPLRSSLVRLNDMYESLCAALCGGPVDADVRSMVSLVRRLAEGLSVTGVNYELPKLDDNNCKVLIDSCDLDTPYLELAAELEPLDGLLRASDRSQIDVPEFLDFLRTSEAEIVFLASADVHYVAEYARPYLLSILRSADVPFVVVINVIGGRDQLRAVAETVGVFDPRVFFVGDTFDAASVTTLCYVENEIEPTAKPLAHYQSSRFQTVEQLLDIVDRPVLVSDIDCILERGVGDLIAAHRLDDVVLNENTHVKSFASKITANLLMFMPTPGARSFSRYLRSYLAFQLSKRCVSRWIDQIALLITRHYATSDATQCQLGYFDTDTDINNVMYRSYQPHPFRFLSLYRGFDMTTLDPDLR